jgi:hypothetical protein
MEGKTTLAELLLNDPEILAWLELSPRQGDELRAPRAETDRPIRRPVAA